LNIDEPFNKLLTRLLDSQQFAAAICAEASNGADFSPSCGPSRRAHIPQTNVISATRTSGSRNHAVPTMV
jgi:hypothetical protein